MINDSSSSVRGWWSDTKIRLCSGSLGPDFHRFGFRPIRHRLDDHRPRCAAIQLGRNDSKISVESLRKPGFEVVWKMTMESGPGQRGPLTPPALMDFYIGYRGFRTLDSSAPHRIASLPWTRTRTKGMGEELASERRRGYCRVSRRHDVRSNASDQSGLPATAKP